MSAEVVPWVMLGAGVIALYLYVDWVWVRSPFGTALDRYWLVLPTLFMAGAYQFWLLSMSGGAFWMRWAFGAYLVLSLVCLFTGIGKALKRKR